VAVGEQIETTFEQIFDVVEVRIGSGDLSFDSLRLGSDPSLFLLQKVQRYRIGVVSPKQLLLLPIEDGQTLRSLCSYLFVLAPPGIHFCLAELSEQIGELGLKLDMGPFVLNVGFDELDRYGFLMADGASAVVGQTEEVQILVPVAVLGLGNAESTSTLSTEHTALEVMVVDPHVENADVPIRHSLLYTRPAGSQRRPTVVQDDRWA
jgi:hypothetical protein